MFFFALSIAAMIAIKLYRDSCYALALNYPAIMNFEKLLTVLSDGEFHSGEDLCRRLGVSRTAVWKQIARLQELGIQVNAVKGRGYRLPQRVDLLSLPTIYEHLDKDACDIFKRIDLELVTESTNRLAAAASIMPYVCLAELQTAGRGRRGREWVSPFAANVYLSLAWRFTEAAASLDSLSLCMAVALLRALRGLGCVDLQLKWPNDLLCNGKKLAGILLEASGEVGGSISVVVGIGLNVAMTQGQGKSIEQDWAALNDILDRQVSRNEVVAAILTEMASAFPAFERQGFAAFEQDWRSFDCLANRAVVLHLGVEDVSGVARGVDATGALRVEHEGTVKLYRGGEVSVRTSQ